MIKNINNLKFQKLLTKNLIINDLRENEFYY